jgi:transposase InsO family protein
MAFRPADPGMSRRGNCLDDAVAESFLSTFKSDRAEDFDSYADAKDRPSTTSRSSTTSSVGTRRSDTSHLPTSNAAIERG